MAKMLKLSSNYLKGVAPESSNNFFFKIYLNFENIFKLIFIFLRFKVKFFLIPVKIILGYVLNLANFFNSFLFKLAPTLYFFTPILVLIFFVQVPVNFSLVLKWAYFIILWFFFIIMIFFFIFFFYSFFFKNSGVLLSYLKSKVFFLLKIFNFFFDRGFIYSPFVTTVLFIFTSVIKRIALPLRIFIRIFFMIFSVFRALTLLFLNDFILFFKNFINFFKSKSIFMYLRRVFFFLFFFLFFISTDSIFFISDTALFSQPQTKIPISLVSLILFFKPIVASSLVHSVALIFIVLEVCSLYFSVSVSKRLLFSIYLVVLFYFLIFCWSVPESLILSNFFIKFNGFILFLLFTFRALREDQRFFNNIVVDPFKFSGEPTTFKSPRRVSIVYRFFDRVFNPILEHIFIIFLFIFFYIYFGGNELRDLVNIPFLFSNVSNFCQFFLFIFFFFRQSSYAYYVWFFSFIYLFVWSVVSTAIFSSSNFSYFGNILNLEFLETSAVGVFGMLSSSFGLEMLIAPLDDNLIPYYYGENFYMNSSSLSDISKFDTFQFANTPFSVFGDMSTQPFLATPHDDHNWTISNSLERAYFDNARLEKSSSDVLGGDSNKYWPVERNFYNFFGEFVESDLYYGWSHSVLIDTQTFFDYSPYSLTNIFGDSFMKNIVTDIFTIFVGPVELDESNLLNLRDWGSSYSPGATTNRISGGESSGLENSSNLNREQLSRENGESFHEWFPGLYVLDGRLDSKFSLFFLRILLVFLIPILIISFLFSSLGKPSNNFDENFGELEFTNFNFYFFGNEQTETFSTYYWNPVYTSNFEWPVDDYSNDPIAYEPTNNLFEDLFKNVQSGLFNYTILDSFFYLPILKHTESFTSLGYKDFVMPLIFPTGSDSKTARIVDFSNFYSNIKKITETSRSGSDGPINNSIAAEKLKYSKNYKYTSERPERFEFDDFYTSNTSNHHLDNLLMTGIKKLNISSGAGGLSKFWRLLNPDPVLNNFSNFSHSGFGFDHRNDWNFVNIFNNLSTLSTLQKKNIGIKLLSQSNYDVKNYINISKLERKQRAVKFKEPLDWNQGNLLFEKSWNFSINKKSWDTGLVPWNRYTNFGQNKILVKNNLHKIVIARFDARLFIADFVKALESVDRAKKRLKKLEFFFRLFVNGVFALNFIGYLRFINKIKYSLVPTWPIIIKFVPTLSFKRLQQSPNFELRRLEQWEHFAKRKRFSIVIFFKSFSKILKLRIFLNSINPLTGFRKGVTVFFKNLKYNEWDSFVEFIRISINLKKNLNFFSSFKKLSILSKSSSIYVKQNEKTLKFMKSILILGPLFSKTINRCAVTLFESLLLHDLLKIFGLYVKNISNFFCKFPIIFFKSNSNFFFLKNTKFSLLISKIFIQIKLLIGNFYNYKNLNCCFSFYIYSQTIVNCLGTFNNFFKNTFKKKLFILKIFKFFFFKYDLITHNGFFFKNFFYFYYPKRINSYFIHILFLLNKFYIIFQILLVFVQLNFFFKKKIISEPIIIFLQASDQVRGRTKVSKPKHKKVFKPKEQTVGLFFYISKIYNQLPAHVLSQPTTLKNRNNSKNLQPSSVTSIIFFKKHRFRLFSLKSRFENEFIHNPRTLIEIGNRLLLNVDASFNLYNRIGCDSVLGTKEFFKSKFFLNFWDWCTFNSLTSWKRRGESLIGSQYFLFFFKNIGKIRKRLKILFLKKIATSPIVATAWHLRLKFYIFFNKIKTISSKLIANSFFKCTENYLKSKSLFIKTMSLEKNKKIKNLNIAINFKKIIKFHKAFYVHSRWLKYFKKLKPFWIAKPIVGALEETNPPSNFSTDQLPTGTVGVRYLFDTLIKEQWHNGFSNKIPVKKIKNLPNAEYKSQIPLNVYIPNERMSQFLANEVAYNLNFEYSTLFESLISELLSPDGTRHNSLEFEFEDTNPDYSTVTEYADPDKNFAESELFENDTIIDDPRSFEFTENTDRGWLFRKVKKHSRRYMHIKRFANTNTDWVGDSQEAGKGMKRRSVMQPFRPWVESNEYISFSPNPSTSFSQNNNIFGKVSNLKNIMLSQSINHKSVQWLDGISRNIKRNKKGYVHSNQNYILRVLNLFKFRVRALGIKNALLGKIKKLSKYATSLTTPPENNLNFFLKSYDLRVSYFKKILSSFFKYAYSSNIKFFELSDNVMGDEPRLFRFFSYLKINYMLPTVGKFSKSTIQIPKLLKSLNLRTSSFNIRRKGCKLHLVLNFFLNKNLNLSINPSLGSLSVFKNYSLIKTQNIIRMLSGVYTINKSNSYWEDSIRLDRYFFINKNSGNAMSTLFNFIKIIIFQTKFSFYGENLKLNKTKPLLLIKINTAAKRLIFSNFFLKIKSNARGRISYFFYIYTKTHKKKFFNVVPRVVNVYKTKISKFKLLNSYKNNSLSPHNRLTLPTFFSNLKFKQYLFGDTSSKYFKKIYGFLCRKRAGKVLYKKKLPKFEFKILKLLSLIVFSCFGTLNLLFNNPNNSLKNAIYSANAFYINTALLLTPPTIKQNSVKVFLNLENLNKFLSTRSALSLNKAPKQIFFCKNITIDGPLKSILSMIIMDFVFLLSLRPNFNPSAYGMANILTLILSLFRNSTPAYIFLVEMRTLKVTSPNGHVLKKIIKIINSSNLTISYFRKSITICTVVFKRIEHLLIASRVRLLKTISDGYSYFLKIFVFLKNFIKFVKLTSILFSEKQYLLKSVKFFLTFIANCYKKTKYILINHLSLIFKKPIFSFFDTINTGSLTVPVFGTVSEVGLERCRRLRRVMGKFLKKNKFLRIHYFKRPPFPNIKCLDTESLNRKAGITITVIKNRFWFIRKLKDSLKSTFLKNLQYIYYNFKRTAAPENINPGFSGNFFREYGSLWVLEFLKFNSDKLRGNFGDKDLKKNTHFIKKIKKSTLYSLIGDLSLPVGVRNYLKRKYPNYVHKKSIFILAPTNIQKTLKINFLFFMDYTEAFIRFLFKKMTFGYLSTFIKNSENFSFWENFINEQNRSSKSDYVSKRLEFSFKKSGRLRRGSRYVKLRNKMFSFLKSYDQKMLDNYGIFRLTRSFYSKKGLSSSFFSELTQNILNVYQSFGFWEQLSLCTNFLRTRSRFAIKEFLKKYGPSGSISHKWLGEVDFIFNKLIYSLHKFKNIKISSGFLNPARFRSFWTKTIARSTTMSSSQISFMGDYSSMYIVKILENWLSKNIPDLGHESLTYLLNRPGVADSSSIWYTTHYSYRPRNNVLGNLLDFDPIFLTKLEFSITTPNSLFFEINIYKIFYIKFVWSLGISGPIYSKFWIRNFFWHKEFEVKRPKHVHPITWFAGSKYVDVLRSYKNLKKKYKKNSFFFMKLAEYSYIFEFLPKIFLNKMSGSFTPLKLNLSPKKINIKKNTINSVRFIDFISNKSTMWLDKDPFVDSDLVSFFMEHPRESLNGSEYYYYKHYNSYYFFEKILVLLSKGLLPPVEKITTMRYAHVYPKVLSIELKQYNVVPAIIFSKSPPSCFIKKWPTTNVVFTENLKYTRFDKLKKILFSFVFYKINFNDSCTHFDHLFGNVLLRAHLYKKIVNRGYNLVIDFNCSLDFLFLNLLRKGPTFFGYKFSKKRIFLKENIFFYTKIGTLFSKACFFGIFKFRYREFTVPIFELLFLLNGFFGYNFFIKHRFGTNFTTYRSFNIKPFLDTSEKLLDFGNFKTFFFYNFTKGLKYFIFCIKNVIHPLNLTIKLYKYYKLSRVLVKFCLIKIIKTNKRLPAVFITLNTFCMPTKPRPNILTYGRPAISFFLYKSKLKNKKRVLFFSKNFFIFSKKLMVSLCIFVNTPNHNFNRNSRRLTLKSLLGKKKFNKVRTFFEGGESMITYGRKNYFTIFLFDKCYWCFANRVFSSKSHFILKPDKSYVLRKYEKDKRSCPEKFKVGSFKVKNFSWVTSVYSRLIKISNFRFTKKNRQKKIDFLKWRSSFSSYSAIGGLHSSYTFMGLRKFYFLKKLIESVNTASYSPDMRTDMIFGTRLCFKISKIFFNFKNLKNFFLIKFIVGPKKNKTIGRYNYEQSIDFLIDLVFYWFCSNNVIFFSKNIYKWLDFVKVRWKEQKLLILLHRNGLKSCNAYPYSNIVPEVFYDFFIILDKTQPITIEDCLYFRDYTKFFLHKLIFFIKKKKLTLGFVKSSSMSKIVSTVNFKFLNRFVWVEFIFSKVNNSFSKISYAVNNFYGTGYKTKNRPFLHIFNKKMSEVATKRDLKHPPLKKYENFSSLESSLDYSEKSISIKDQHWTHIERFDTWTDSSNTSLTSITSFDSQVYWAKSQYSWFVLKAFFRSYRNRRFKALSSDKKLRYLKNISVFGVSYPIPFKPGLSFSIYEDPFDEFLFNNTAGDNYDFMTPRDRSTNKNETDRTDYPVGRFGAESVTDATEMIAKPRIIYGIGRQFKSDRRFLGKHPYDYRVNSDLIKKHKKAHFGLYTDDIYLKKKIKKNKAYEDVSQLSKKSFDVSELYSNYLNYNSWGLAERSNRVRSHVVAKSLVGKIFVKNKIKNRIFKERATTIPKKIWKFKKKKAKRRLGLYNRRAKSVKKLKKKQILLKKSRVSRKTNSAIVGKFGNILEDANWLKEYVYPRKKDGIFNFINKYTYNSEGKNNYWTRNRQTLLLGYNPSPWRIKKPSFLFFKKKAKIYPRTSIKWFKKTLKKPLTRFVKKTSYELFTGKKIVYWAERNAGPLRTLTRNPKVLEAFNRQYMGSDYKKQKLIQKTPKQLALGLFKKNLNDVPYQFYIFKKLKSKFPRFTKKKYFLKTKFHLIRPSEIIKIPKGVGFEIVGVFKYKKLNGNGSFFFLRKKSKIRAKRPQSKKILRRGSIKGRFAYLEPPVVKKNKYSYLFKKVYIERPRVYEAIYRENFEICWNLFCFVRKGARKCKFLLVSNPTKSALVRKEVKSLGRRLHFWKVLKNINKFRYGPFGKNIYFKFYDFCSPKRFNHRMSFKKKIINFFFKKRRYRIKKKFKNTGSSFLLERRGVSVNSTYFFWKNNSRSVDVFKKYKSNGCSNMFKFLHFKNKTLMPFPKFNTEPFYKKNIYAASSSRSRIYVHLTIVKSAVRRELKRKKGSLDFFKKKEIKIVRPDGFGVHPSIVSLKDQKAYLIEKKTIPAPLPYPFKDTNILFLRKTSFNRLMRKYNFNQRISFNRSRANAAKIDLIRPVQPYGGILTKKYYLSDMKNRLKYCNIADRDYYLFTGYRHFLDMGDVIYFMGRYIELLNYEFSLKKKKLPIDYFNRNLKIMAILQLVKRVSIYRKKMLPHYMSKWTKFWRSKDVLKHNTEDSVYKLGGFFKKIDKYRSVLTLPGFFKKWKRKIYKRRYRRGHKGIFEYYKRYRDDLALNATSFELSQVFGRSQIGRKINRKHLSKAPINKHYESYFRVGGLWERESTVFGRKNIKNRYFQLSVRSSNRLRNMGEHNYLNLSIHNRNYLKTDNTSYRTKYLVNSPEYRKEKLGIYLKKNKYLNMHEGSFSYDLVYKTVPYFFRGTWSGSDSGQTVFDYKKYKISENNPDYKTFNPIFGLFVLNPARLKKDLLKNNWNYREPSELILGLGRKLFLFVSDHDTQFFDDKVIVVQNIFLFWLEFFRYLYINRWSLTVNYTKTKNDSFSHKYPIGFVSEYYWYKFLVFSKFIKKRLTIRYDLNKKSVIVSKIKKKIFDKFRILFFDLINNFFSFSIKLPRTVSFDFFFNKKINEYLKFYKKHKNKIFFKKTEILYEKLPNFKVYPSFWTSNNVIIFSKSIEQSRSKKTNAMVGFYKPYKNAILKNPYEISPIVADTESPIKKYLHFLTIKAKRYSPGLANSESDTNMYLLKNYVNHKKPKYNFKSGGSLENYPMMLDINPLSNSWIDKKTNYFRKVKDGNYSKFRNSARKDSNLLYKRNWFFSNHILDSWVQNSAISGHWAIFSDFEVDRHRDFSRNSKHGSKYRLNFNTELWWTRTEVPDYNFRRVDGSGYDKRTGILDSDGELSHLLKGFSNVVNIAEGLDIYETSLPLFERSLVDPESPALNEDGEFPEYDINVIYNSEIKKRLNFLKRSTDIITQPGNTYKKIFKKFRDFSEILGDYSASGAFLQEKNELSKTKEYLNRSYSFRQGSVDWNSELFVNNSLASEIKNLVNSATQRSYNELYRISENQVNMFDLNPIDLPDVVDVLSNQNVHPISNSVENIFNDLIDQKIDEALESYSLTGVSYDSLFINHTKSLKINEIGWNHIDFFSEHSSTFLENPLSFDFSLILHKYSPNYWKYVLEVDSSWSSNYAAAFPQINDSVNSIDEYLPIWNYDPSIWELHGYDYEITPLLNSDDSKMLLNSKTARFDMGLKWLSQKDLTSPGVSISSLGWGGADIVSGLAAHLPYDMLYGSDDDSDFEMYSEYFFTRNWEDSIFSPRIFKKTKYSTSRTTTEEYPQSGFFKEIAIKNKNLTAKAKSRDTSKLKKRRMSGNLGKSLVSRKAVKVRAMYGFNRKKFNFLGKHKTLFTGSFDMDNLKRKLYRKYLANEAGGQFYNTKLANGNSINISRQHNNYLKSYFRRKRKKIRLKISGVNTPNIRVVSHNTNILSRKLNQHEHNDIIYQVPLGLENNKSRYISENFWKLMYVYFLSKLDFGKSSFYRLRDGGQPQVSSNRFLDSDSTRLLAIQKYSTNWNSYKNTNSLFFEKNRFGRFLDLIAKPCHGVMGVQLPIVPTINDHVSSIFNLNTLNKYSEVKNLFLKKKYNIFLLYNYFYKNSKKKKYSVSVYKKNVRILNSKFFINIRKSKKFVFRNSSYFLNFTKPISRFVPYGYKSSFITKKTKNKKSSRFYGHFFNYKDNNNTVLVNNVGGVVNVERSLFSLFHNKVSSLFKRRREQLFNFYPELENTLKFSEVGSFNYPSSNFNLGTKRGGVGDSSHWSSGTEYLNEHYRRKFSQFEKIYNISKFGIKNSRYPMAGEIESQHTDSGFRMSYDVGARRADSNIYGKADFSTTDGSAFSAEIMSEVGNEIDDFYDDKFKNEQNLELFSYIDWGFNTDRDFLDSDVNFLASDPFTADLLRDPTTESVYLDIIQNEYGKVLREFPEEVVDWTVSDFYSEVMDAGEISDIPNSTNESELYSADSSNSVSDFYAGSDDNSELGIETLHISEEMSTDFNDFDMHNGNQNKKKKFEIFNDIVRLQYLDATVAPITHPELDMFSQQNNSSIRNRTNFSDTKETPLFDSEENSSIFGKDWTDFSKVELEENTRELESFYKQQKYIDSYRLEGVFEEILIKINVDSSVGVFVNLGEILTTKDMVPKSLKNILFKKTKYLNHYRGFMRDLNLIHLMF